jgi:hypothetical protein
MIRRFVLGLVAFGLALGGLVAPAQASTVASPNNGVFCCTG